MLCKCTLNFKFFSPSVVSYVRSLAYSVLKTQKFMCNKSSIKTCKDFAKKEISALWLQAILFLFSCLFFVGSFLWLFIIMMCSPSLKKKGKKSKKTEPLMCLYVRESSNFYDFILDISPVFLLPSLHLYPSFCCEAVKEIKIYEWRIERKLESWPFSPGRAVGEEVKRRSSRIYHYVNNEPRSSDALRLIRLKFYGTLVRRSMSD